MPPIYLLTQDHYTTPGCYRRMVVEADTEGDAREEANAYAVAKEDITAGVWTGEEGMAVSEFDGDNHGGVLLATTEAG
jgi:hypothetical protein